MKIQLLPTVLFPATLGLSLLVGAGLSAQATTVPKAQTTASAQAKTQAAAPMVLVQNAWVRAMVPGQKVGAAYMQLQALQSGVKLLSVRSSAAPTVQLHGMQMQGDVMRMFEIKNLNLPKGQTVTLDAGGMHIMLMDVPQPLLAGSQITLNLQFSGGKSQAVVLPVLNQAPPQPAAAASAEHQHH